MNSPNTYKTMSGISTFHMVFVVKVFILRQKRCTGDGNRLS